LSSGAASSKSSLGSNGSKQKSSAYSQLIDFIEIWVRKKSRRFWQRLKCGGSTVQPINSTQENAVRNKRRSENSRRKNRTINDDSEIMTSLNSAVKVDELIRGLFVEVLSMRRVARAPLASPEVSDLDIPTATRQIDTDIRRTGFYVGAPRFTSDCKRKVMLSTGGHASVAKQLKQYDDLMVGHVNRDVRKDTECGNERKIVAIRDVEVECYADLDQSCWSLNNIDCSDVVQESACDNGMTINYPNDCYERDDRDRSSV